jgi:hypothetical protein
MKIKFIRALVATIACLIIFLATTFIPSLRAFKAGDFMQGFSGGAGVGALVASIFYYSQLKNQQKTTEQINETPIMK